MCERVFKKTRIFPVGEMTDFLPTAKPEENVGARLTSRFLLEPEQSTSATVVHHPGAKYFVV
jgi:5-methyltetrahydrofolate--homocysteine methyltransferase